MKVTYVEQIECHIAFSRKMYCPVCGGHEYEIVQQLEPATYNPWLIRCAQCSAEGPESPAKEIAITRWKQC